jgi:hypothetical protein
LLYSVIVGIDYIRTKGFATGKNISMLYFVYLVYLLRVCVFCFVLFFKFCFCFLHQFILYENTPVNHTYKADLVPVTCTLVLDICSIQINVFNTPLLIFLHNWKKSWISFLMILFVS